MNILVADDHAIVRKGLIELLREEFPKCEIFEAVNSNEVMQQIKNRDMDIVLLDISMPGRNGMETLKQIRTNGVKTPVLMLSMHPEDQFAIRALKAGASGFMNKEAATDQLLTAVHSILKGKKYIPYTIAEKLLASSDHGNKPLHELLSDRELDVLQKIASGKTVSEIADDLSLSVNTISTYRARLLDKLGLTSNAALARYAIDHNLG
jgi:two-component system, NarL family, invasion response regulator UvrY